MSTTQKIAVTAVVTVAVGIGVFQAHRAGQMRAKLQEAERQAQPLAEEVDQLRQERDQAASRLKAVEEQIELLERDTAELAKLRGDVTRLRNDAQELASLKAQLTVNPPVSPAVTNTPLVEPIPAELAARVALLYQNLQQRPERQIPELQFIDDKDWLEAAKLAVTESDTDVRKALSLLRLLAKYKLGRLLRPTLLKYTEANNGDLPTDMLQLKPFFTEPVDDALLQRYEMVATGNTGEPGFDPFKRVVRERAEVLPDSLYDGRMGVSFSGGGASGGPSMVRREKDSPPGSTSGAQVYPTPDGTQMLLKKP